MHQIERDTTVGGMSEIGQRITFLRTEAGLSLSKLASKAGISKSLLHRIENKEGANPELETLRKIAKALGMTVGHLLDNEIVKNVRRLPEEKPSWLKDLVDRLVSDGKEPNPDILESLYVLQNRQGGVESEVDWHYIYQTLELGISKR